MLTRLKIVRVCCKCMTNNVIFVVCLHSVTGQIWNFGSNKRSAKRSLTSKLVACCLRTTVSTHKWVKKLKASILFHLLLSFSSVHVHNDFLLAILTRCQIIVSTPGIMLIFFISVFLCCLTTISNHIGMHPGHKCRILLLLYCVCVIILMLNVELKRCFRSPFLILL